MFLISFIDVVICSKEIPEISTISFLYLGFSKSLYEIKNTNSCATLIEVLFHDDYMQAKFITTNYYKIAKAIFDGIVSYLD